MWDGCDHQDHGLLDKPEEGQAPVSSSERRQKHGERKRLGQLRREQRNQARTRKVLKLEDDVSWLLSSSLCLLVITGQVIKTVSKRFLGNVFFGLLNIIVNLVNTCGNYPEAVRTEIAIILHLLEINVYYYI